MHPDWLTPFGSSILQVSRLGLGAGRIGDGALAEAEVERFLHGVVDHGVSLIDTACGYGLSEERIGRALKDRRDEIVLSTKIGYGVDGFTDWTPEIMIAGVDQALERLQTEILDIVHLHSCPLLTLQNDAMLRAFERCQASGKVRLLAYSGENIELSWAASSRRFQSIETSVNLFDQWSLDHVLPTAVKRRLGVIAKRPIANACWRHAEQPVGDYSEGYWLRMKELNLPDFGLPIEELAIRFSAYAPGVCSVIVGTNSLEHLLANKAAVEKGPLPPEVVAACRAAFEAHPDWPGLI